jgi:hypothetical protein
MCTYVPPLLGFEVLDVVNFVLGSSIVDPDKPYQYLVSSLVPS